MFLTCYFPAVQLIYSTPPKKKRRKYRCQMIIVQSADSQRVKQSLAAISKLLPVIPAPVASISACQKHCKKTKKKNYKNDETKVSRR